MEERKKTTSEDDVLEPSRDARSSKVRSALTDMLAARAKR